MNYSGKFDAKLPIDGTGAHSHGHLHVDSVSAHALQAPAGAIIVPDAQLLFNGDFKRSGVDLVLSNDDHELVLQDYFKGEKRAALSSPDGAHLTGDIVNALTGHQQFAQAAGGASVGKVIGHVSKLVGTATAIRNGVSIILNNGDDVQKGDVVQSGSGSTLGITFIDGTVFGLSSNAKMVLNEMVYDPNGSNNSSLLSLVAGTISFVAGETAKHGDMKVDTPVATMGIRGTAVLVEIDFDVPQNGLPNAKFQVLVEPDGHTGNYVLYDKVTLAPIATVDQAGVVKSLSQGILTSYSAPLSADVQKLISDVFSLKFTDNTNTKSFDHYTDTLQPQALTPIKLADGAIAVPIIVNVTGSAPSSGPGGTVDPLGHIPGPPTVVAPSGAGIELPNVTHSPTLDIVTGQIIFFDPNRGDAPTVTTKFDSFTYQNAQQQDVTATLNAQQLADIAKVEANLLLTAAPGNNNSGAVTWTYSVADSAFDFLAAGETLTLTYEARVDNNFAPNDEFGLQKFTITITRGSNDVPVITTGPQTVPFSGGTTTTGGDLPATGPTSGTLAFTDVDLTDTHTVSAKLASAVLPGVVIPPGPLAAFQAALSASMAADSTGSGSGTINWKLADLPVFLADFIPKGETLTLTYTVTVTDSQGASSTQNIIVTITGTNDPAVVWIATTTPGSQAGGLWSNAANWETGTVPTLNDDVIIITDQLRGLAPSFPVTIDAPAFAKSVTMNDFGTSAPKLINQSTLTISGVLSLAADSIVENDKLGTIGVGGLMEVLNTSVLQNAGLITLAQGGDFRDQSTISNTITGTIDVSGGTLHVQVNIANSGKVTVESNAKLTLGSAAIDGGTVTNKGEIDLTGNAVLKNGVLGNSGQIDVSGTGNALDAEIVTNADTALIAVTGVLMLDLGTSIAGGILTNSGLVKIETAAGATLDGVHVQQSGSGIIQVDDATLSLQGKLVVDDGTTIVGGTLTVGSLGLFEVETHLGATLGGVKVGNSGVVQVDAGSVLNLDGTTITGGTVTDNGTIHITGDSAIDGAKVNGGYVTVDADETLTLDGTTVTGTTITDNGTVKVDANDTLHLSGVTLTGGAVTVGAQGLIQTGGDVTLSGTTVTNDGTIEVHDGILSITGSIAGGGAVKIDGGALFELNGSDTQNIVFAGAGGELQIDAGSFGGKIVGLAATDELDLRTIGFGANTTGTYVSNANNDGGVLTITDGKQSISLTLVGDYSKAHFAGGKDGHGGTLITLNAVDDVPAFAAAEKAQTGVVTELSNTTGSSTHDASIGGAIDFTDIDLTERPTATITGQSVTWTAADHSTNLSSSLTSSEIDALEHALALAQSNNTNNGAIGWTYSIPDGALDFLAAGETATVVSTVTLDDHAGGTDTASVTITITGANDTPVLAADTSSAYHSSLHAIPELANTTGDTDLDTASGALTFTDADLSDTHTASHGAPSYAWSGGDLTKAQTDVLTAAATLALHETDSTHSGAGVVSFSYSAADKAFDFLAANETLTITYDVTVTDNNGASSVRPVTITVTGTNDAASIGDPSSASVTDNTAVDGSGNLVATGSIPITDPDHGQSSFQTTVTAAAGDLGSLSLNADGTYTYTVANKAAEHLAAGETKVDTFTVTSVDGTTKDVTFTIHGINDAPIILSETDPATQAVMVLMPVKPILLDPGATTNSLGLNTETFNDQTPGSPSEHGAGHGKFYSAALDATFVASGNAGVVNGSSGVSAAPLFGPLPGTADTTNYLSIGADATETITFANEENAFGLYWGSANVYNTINFYHGTTLVASYSGLNDILPLFSNGAQDGYVEFSGLASFDKVVLGTENINAFEIDNISAGTVAAPHVELAAPITGTLTVSDADIGDTLTASVIGNAVLKYNGSMNIPGDVDISKLIASSAITFDSVKSDGGADVLHWSYDPTNPDLDFLKSGDTLTITYMAQVNDGHGNIGSQPLTVTIAGTNPSANTSQFQVVNGTSQNDTFNVGANQTIFGAGGHDTFVFKPGFGSATIGDFDVTNDTINIDQTLVKDLSVFLANAHAANSGLDTILTDDALHTIKLAGVTVAQVQAHPNDFHLV